MTDKDIQEIKARLEKLEANDVVVAIVLDKSGSMQSKRAVAINGYNEFIEANKNATPNARLIKTLFDTVVHTPEVSLAKDISRMTKGKYVPAGMTALYDAIGKTIETIENLDGSKNKVVVAIITDGEENNSLEYTQKQIFNLIKKHQKKDWQFTFIGADIDAYKSAGSIGIRAGSTLSVTGSWGMGAGGQAMTDSVIGYTTGVRSVVGYDDDVKTKVENKT